MPWLNDAVGVLRTVPYREELYKHQWAQGYKAQFVCVSSSLTRKKLN